MSDSSVYRVPTPLAPATSPLADGDPMLVPQTALRILCRRTGGTLSRSAFYRWLRSGKIVSVRLGSRIFIPKSALDALIRNCYEVDG